MPDIFLYQGDATPRDVVLRDPTTSGGVTVSPVGIASGEAYGTPTLTYPINIIDAGNIPSQESFGTTSLSETVSPSSITTLEAFGTPTVVEAILITAVAIASSEAFGAPSVSFEITAIGIVSGQAFGSANLSQSVSAVSINSVEAFGAALLTFVVRPSSIASQESLGTPVLSIAGMLSGAGNIPSAETFGSATVSEGVIIVPVGVVVATVTSSASSSQFSVSSPDEQVVASQLVGTFSAKGG